MGKIPKTKVLETSPEPRYKRRTGLEPLYLSAYELERFADPRLFSMLLGTGIHGGISMISLDLMHRQLYPGLEDNELSLLTLYHTELSHLPSYALLALRSLDISPEGDILCSAIETQGGDQLPLRVSSGVESYDLKMSHTFNCTQVLGQ